MASRKLTKKKAIEAATRRINKNAKNKGKCPDCKKPMNKCNCKGY